MKEIVATVSSKGQVTIPAVIRKHLGITEPDKIAFVVEEDGSVQLRPVQFTLEVEDVFGAIPALPNESVDLDREIELATEEEVDQKMQRWKRQ
jgi:AbrB family looped-hinge helix DNA binding protein